MRKTRKHYRFVLTALALTLMASCASGTAESESPSQRTITWWDYFGYSPASNQAVDTLIARYQQEHPHVQIKRTAVEFGKFHDKLVEAESSGTFPDIAVVDTSDVPWLASQNAIANLTPQFDRWDKANQFLEPVLDSVTHQDNLFGVPLRSNTTALIYNKDQLAQASIATPPATWQDLRTNAKALTEDGRHGLCFGAAANETLTFNFLPLLWQAGGDVGTIAEKPGVDALGLLDAFFNKDQSVPEDALTWSHSDAQKAFEQGRCAMMINGPWVLPSVAKAPFQWGTAPLPAGEKGVFSTLGGEAWVIGSRSPNSDVAWDVLQWLAESRNSAKELGGGLGAIPNRNDTLNDPVWKWGPGVGAYISEMLSTRSRSNYGPQYSKVSEAVWTMTHQVVKGEKKPQAAATEAAAKIRPLLPTS
ncbi:sugar ABC transporter substrate-binding protein [Lentzea alba]|uniref:ABC transporter substrate-binding protein n=1 Tax=Lentzea alba TaxID=2714351 RepID=UPI0039BF77E8